MKALLVAAAAKEQKLIGDGETKTGS